MKPSSSRMRERKFIDLLRKTKWSKWAHRFSVTLQGLLKIRLPRGQPDSTRNRISWSFWPTEKAGQVGGQGFANLWPPACQNQRAKMARWRESRGNALPSDMMLCVISYWVLSGAKRRQIQQLRCCVLPRQAVEMKEAPAKPYTKIRKK